MQSFVQSDFLQALAYSLIASIWQVGLLWFATFAMIRLFSFSSKQKFNIAFVAQLTGFILFLFTFIHAFNNGSGKIITGAVSESSLSNINIYLNEYLPYVAITYLSILFYKTSRLIFFYKGTQHLRNEEISKIAAINRIFVQEMSELLSLKRKVKIYLSSKINCPLTIGFLKPIILIPLAAVNQLTTEQMEAVILHELAHIKRADYLLFLLQTCIEKIFFFNIFSKLLGDIIERERENACDDWVLQFRYNSMHYAEALFKLGRLKTVPAFAMAVSGKKESLLLVRVKRLLHKSESRATCNSFLFSLLFMMIAGCLLVSFSVKPVNRKIAENVKTEVQNNINSQVAFYENAIPVKTTPTKTENNSTQSEVANSAPVSKESTKQNSDEIAVTKEIETAPENQNYFVNVQQALDSLNQTLPKYTEAINSQVVVTPEVLRKVMSYQNFKPIENMLAVTGDSVNITETDISKDSYKKQITIESTDKDGNKHIYQVIVELYQ